MSMSLTELRANLYRVIDQVIKSGQAIEIKRKGHIVRIVPGEKKNKLANLAPHPDVINGDPEDLVHIDWSDEWREDDNL